MIKIKPMILTQSVHDYADDIANLAYKSLLMEVCLTPKPGLVDSNNSGAHRDMNFLTFYQSAKTIAPYFKQFVLLGAKYYSEPADNCLPYIRILGQQCEQAMLSTTSGVNTHKGAIFAFGLVCSALGRLFCQNQQKPSSAVLSKTIQSMCHGIVQRELQHIHRLNTAGRLAYHYYGYSGARGEAESGFATVIEGSLPLFKQLLLSGFNEKISLLHTLVYLMMVNNDTNIIKRGGIASLHYVQAIARDMFLSKSLLNGNGIELLDKLDHDFILRNLSPGGSADLLALTYFLQSCTW